MWLGSLAFASSLAAAAQGTVAVLPIEVKSFPGATAEKRGQIDQALRDVLGARYRSADDAGQACAASVDCRADAADKHSADEVVHIALRKADSGGYAEVTLQVFDVDGQPVVKDQASLTVKGSANELRALLLRAFEPSEYAGTVRVTGLAAGEEALIDGIPTADGLARVSVGEHTVSVVGENGARREQTVRVAFDATATADLSATAVAPAEVVVGVRPVWPAIVAIVATAAGVGVLGGAITVALVDSFEAERARGRMSAGLNLPSDPESSDWDKGYGPQETNENNSAKLRWVAINANTAVANETAASVLWFPAVIGGVVAVGGAATAFLLWPAAEAVE